MCFIKVSHEGLSIESAFQPPYKCPTQIKQSSAVCQDSNIKMEKYYEFLEVFVSFNFQYIEQMNQNLQRSVKSIENINQIVGGIPAILKYKQTDANKLIKSNEPIIYKVFGQKYYKYKLSLAGKFPKTLYKERNFDLSIVLKNQNGDIIRNANSLSIYLGVITDEGQWIQQNKQGQPIIKGLHQIDLTHGKATFSKIFLREISSNYPNKKLNFIIYPKQSLLKYVNCTNLEKRINGEDIQPLLVKNITILSKRK